MVDAGAVAYLAPLIQHDDSKLKRQVCSCLAQIAKHSVDLAEVCDEGSIPAPPHPPPSAHTRTHVRTCAHAPTHSLPVCVSVFVEQVVVEAEIFPKILTCLGDADTYVRKNAATCVREVAKHTPEVRTLSWLGTGHFSPSRPHLPSPTCPVLPSSLVLCVNAE